MSQDLIYTIFSWLMRYWLWFMCNHCFRFCFQAFKQSLSLSYSAVLGSFLNWWVAEVIACNNRLGKLIIKGEGEGCCVMIWAIIWAIMLVKVWESMMEYISREEADWFESRVALKL